MATLDDDKFVRQVNRMLTRMSGVRSEVRSDAERNLIKEEFCERSRGEIIETQVATTESDDEETFVFGK